MLQEGTLPALVCDAQVAPPSSHTKVSTPSPPITLGAHFGVRERGAFLLSHRQSLSWGGAVLCSRAGSMPSPNRELPPNRQHRVGSHACPQLRAGRRR